ncbi:hypothetical protein Glove_443g54 [Diversispora epigaea]|uniref:RRM domain-containing protein n=1 Tax=Diversispora epigaea TaxID=1348612 RepID=A0A397GW90_9GLOM|nr:hypothetical protein Glove_443g54 [Diversispora epigaea]
MSHAERMSRSLFVSGLSRRTTIEDLEPVFKEFGRLKDVYIPKDFYTREPRGFAYIEYYDERDCEEAYRRATNILLHGRELTVEFARGSRKTPREMRGKDSNRYSPFRRGRYPTSDNSYRPRRHSRSPSRNRSGSRLRYYDEGDRRRPSRYRSRSKSHSRSPLPERRRRSEQLNGLPKSRSQSPHDVPPPVEEKEMTT